MALGRDNNIRSMPCLCGDPSLPYSEYSRPQSPYAFNLTSVPSFRPSLLPIRNFFSPLAQCAYAAALLWLTWEILGRIVSSFLAPQAAEYALHATVYS